MAFIPDLRLSISFSFFMLVPAIGIMSFYQMNLPMVFSVSIFFIYLCVIAHRGKGIEYAIELVKSLNDPRYKLVISHEAGDEGFEYPDWVMEFASEHGVDLRLVTTQISSPWTDKTASEEQYSLWDIYPHADFITYPSLLEGFGNAFLEAIYFKKPFSFHFIH